MSASNLIPQALQAGIAGLDAFAARRRSFWWRLRGAQVARGVKILGPVSCKNPLGLQLGPGAVLASGAKLNIEPGGCIRIGARARIGEQVLITAKRGAVVEIGADSLVNTRSILTCWSRLVIGRQSLVAPHCHITDRNHGLDPASPIVEQRGEVAPITIGDDVWVAGSCIILCGVRIGDGAVVAANSVVNRDVAPMAIVGGSPARLLRSRNALAAEADA